MKNLIKILPLPIDPYEDYFLEDYCWGGRCGWCDGEWGASQSYSDPIIIVNNRYISVTQDVWDEVKEWSNTHIMGMVLLLNESDQALYLLIYGGL